MDGVGCWLTVTKVGMEVWAEEISKILLANLAKLSVSSSSLMEAKISCALVGRR